MIRRISYIYAVFGLIFFLYGACGPTVTVRGGDKPIEMNINVTAKLEIIIRAENIEDMVSGKIPIEIPKEEEKPIEEIEKKDTGGSQSFLESLFIDEAYAEAGSSTEKLRAAIVSRKNRYPEIQRLKSEGCVGENRSGLLSFRPTAKTKSDRDYAKKARVLINAENTDRETIYKIQAERQNVSVDAIRILSAEVHRKRAAKGEWIEVQDEKGKWVWVLKK